MTITAHTRPADDDKPNEDWFGVADGLVVVLDGATIRTDTGCLHGLPWYVQQLGSALIAAAQDADTSLTDVLATAIRAVTEQHRDTCDLEHPGTPSAAVGIARQRGEFLEWATLGDITVMVETGPAGLRVTSDDRVSKTATQERRECDRHLLGTDAKMAAIQAMKPVELANRNVAGGYWIASVEPDAGRHAYTGSALLRDVQRVAVCSDGAMRALELTTLDTPDAVLRALHQDGPAALVEQVRAAEQADADGARVPRNKGTDDATAVLVEMEGTHPS